MPFILSIDTALTTAILSMSSNGEVIADIVNENAKTHATFLQPAIQQLLSKANISINQVDAIAVTAGPGSYTGLRVGMASAKGICFAINKPLILLDSLWLMTMAAIEHYQNAKSTTPDLFCPMIDARRMEVFTGIYDAKGNIQLSPQAIVLNEASFLDQLNKAPVCFFGNGSSKWNTICNHANALFITKPYSAKHLALLSSQLFDKQQFANLAYTEPCYIKPFYEAIKP